MHKKYPYFYNFLIDKKGMAQELDDRRLALKAYEEHSKALVRKITTNKSISEAESKLKDV